MSVVYVRPHKHTHTLFDSRTYETFLCLTKNKTHFFNHFPMIINIDFQMNQS